MPPDILDALNERVLLCDGAMGSRIQSMALDAAKDFQGKENCTEILNATRPDIVRQIHEEYLSAGADIILTNSFGGSPITLSEFDLRDRAHELNKRSAEIAREAADAHKDTPRFVLGSMGPGTKLPTLGHIAYDDLESAYEIQASGLIEGGIDAVLIETCQDLLQVKAAVNGAKLAREKLARKTPIFVTVTVERTGAMLVGSDIGAAATVIESLGVDLIGMNCATGPREMSENVRWLCENWPRLVGVQPNAGLPQLIDGKTSYPLKPDEFAAQMERFVAHFGINCIGGCCGTHAGHVAALDRMLRGLSGSRGRPKPAARHPLWTPSLASLYTPTALRQENACLSIGERCNANGSKHWRELQGKSDWDGCADMAKLQVRDGSHAIDVCTALVGRNESDDMAAVVRRMIGSVQAPLVIDTTDTSVLERALKLYGGKAVINSINFEDGGEAARTRLALAKKFGCAVIALTIDEQGMAKTPERKLDIAQRLYNLAVNEFGLPPEDLLIDPLTFTIATGNEDDRKLALWTLEGIELIRKAVPRCQIVLGISNVSFGLKADLRHVLNSVMLEHAIRRGLTSAILNHTKIKPLHKIPAAEATAAENLIYDRRDDATDPLKNFIALYEGREETKGRAKADIVEVEKRLEQRIIDGDPKGLPEDIEEALKEYKAVEILNTILLPAMKRVGDLFGDGKLQLPFVLQSAEAMKAAVALLEPHMERTAGTSRGVVVLATVKGDVHDIGKNLVDIILRNNGYRVINLGIKQPVEAVIAAAREHNADVIALSGLLVKSTAIMREDLTEMARQGVNIPVILGGAALTRTYVEDECAKVYPRVAYARSAFDALTLMDVVMGGVFDEYLKSRRIRSSGIAKPLIPREPPTSTIECIESAKAKRVSMITEVPKPLFWGTRIAEVSAETLVPFLNERSLFMRQWGYRKQGRSVEEYMQDARRQLNPELRRLLEFARKERAFAPKAVYGYFAAAGEGNDLVLFAPDDQKREIGRWTFPRGKSGPEGGLGPCLSDFVRDIDDAQRDVIALQAVTMGTRASEIAQNLFEDSRFKDYVSLHGLGVELAEAFAEYIHKRIRSDLGILTDGEKYIEKVLAHEYRGSRFSFGYPACPKLEDQKLLLELLGADRIGVTLTESLMLNPEQSTTAVVFHHPKATYFSL